MNGIENVSSILRSASCPDGVYSAGPGISTEQFIDILQQRFDHALGQLEELAPGVYTTKTDPTFASYQNYDSHGSLA